MTTPEQESPLSWGYLIGRLEGQETQMQALKTEMQRLDNRMDERFQEVRGEQREIRDEQRETNRRIDRLYHAAITIGGGIIVALIGVIISLIILIIRS